jgi:MFS family permease
MSKATAQPTTGSHRIVGALSALRHRNYRLYWLGQLSSVLAQNMEGIAQSWLVLELTNSPLLLGLTGLAFAIPTITLTLLGGVIADRADRRRIMIFSQLGSASIFFILATLVVVGRIALWTGRAVWLSCHRWCLEKIFPTPWPSAERSGN